MYELKDYLNSVNHQKKTLMEEEGDVFWEKRYPAFIVNKCLSGLADAVLFANEMNCLHWLDNKLQYDFYLHGLPKKKRFAKWMKASKLKDLDLIKEHFNYSNEKAKVALEILSKEQVEYIRRLRSKGGK